MKHITLTIIDVIEEEKHVHSSQENGIFVAFEELEEYVKISDVTDFHIWMEETHEEDYNFCNRHDIPLYDLDDYNERLKEYAHQHLLNNTSEAPAGSADAMAA